MGTLRSQTNHTGLVINGVLLGDPVAPVRADGSAAAYVGAALAVANLVMAVLNVPGDDETPKP